MLTFTQYLQPIKPYWHLLAWLWIMIISVLSLIPTPASPPIILGYDKLLHFTVYAGLFWWFAHPFLSYHKIGLALMLIGLGGTLEILQSFTSYRSMDFSDFIANSLGILCMFGLLKLSNS